MSQVAAKQISLQANGSIIISDATGKTVVLPPGAEGFVLTIVGGIPAYQAPGSGVDAMEVFKYTVFNLGMG